MSDVLRIAGVAGTFNYKLNVIPAQAPVMTIYSDEARTVVVVPAAVLAAGPNAYTFVASYPATLVAATYYLLFSTVITAGQPAHLDTNDRLVLSSIAGEVTQTDIDQLRGMVGDRIYANMTESEAFFTTDQLNVILLNQGNNLELAAREGWRQKMAEYAGMVDMEQLGNTRKLSQLYRQAKQQYDHYTEVVGGEPSDYSPRVVGTSVDLLAPIAVRGPVVPPHTPESNESRYSSI